MTTDGVLYAGIDLTYNGHAGSLKGTYTIASGGDPDRIRWRYTGAKNVALDPITGDVHLTVADTQLIERAPIAWQSRSGVTVPIGVRYVAWPDGSFGFVVDGYDPALPLVIDPTFYLALKKRFPRRVELRIGSKIWMFLNRRLQQLNNQPQSLKNCLIG